MDLEDVFSHIPFARRMGIELTTVADGHAEGHLDLAEWHSSNPNRMIAHGAVPYALADTVGGAAVVSLNYDVTPTIDMRIDYLAPVTGERIVAAADVARNGNSVATVDVLVSDEEREVARARGVYKTGGGDGDTPWMHEDDAEALD
jgi:uncharacterized protein (TIGR00369 family)